MHFLKSLLLILFLFSFSLSKAQDKIRLSNSLEKIEIGKDIYFLEDPHRSFKIQDVVYKKFKSSFQKTPNFGFSKSAYWIKFTVENNSNEPANWFIELAWPHYDSLFLYTPAQNGFIKTYEGDHQPFYNRRLNHQFFLFNLKLAPEQSKTYYLKIDTKGSVKVPITLWNQKSFYKAVSKKNIANGFYYGVLFIIIILNITFWIFSRFKSILFYVLYVSFFGLFQLSWDGLAFEFLWPDAVWFHNRTVAFFLGFWLLFSLLFTRFFIKSGRYTPIHDKIITGLSLLSIIVIVLSFINVTISFNVGAATGVISCIVITTAGCFAWMDGYKSARFFVLARMLFLLGGVCTGLMTLGVFPANFLTENFLNIAFIGEAIFLSIALIDRVNTSRIQQIQNLNLVAEKTDNYVIITDKNDHIVWVNEAFTKITGYKLSEIKNNKPANILRGKNTQAGETTKRIETAFYSGTKASGEILNYTKNGKPIWLSFNITPIYGNKDKVEKYINIGKDVTEEKFASELLKESEENFRQLTQSMKEVFWLKDVLKNKLVFVNDAFEKIFEEKPQALIDNPKLWSERIHPKDKEKIRAAFKKSKDKGQFNEEFRLLMKNGDIKWVQSRTYPVFDKENNLIKLSGISEDITARKLIEQEIAQKNKDITDSIQYAKKIQQSILPNSTHLNQLIGEHFVLFKPKDIVSGDFYWAGSTKNNLPVFSVIDCTGHGVPGAFMSIIANHLLIEAINDDELTDPAKILEFVRNNLRNTLKNGDINDGMDISLCLLDRKNNQLIHSSAQHRIYIVRNNEMITIKADNWSIDLRSSTKAFVTKQFPLQKGDVIYLSTDGYSDQFGGEKGKKLKTSGLKKLLLKIHTLPIKEQEESLNTFIERWKGSYEQIDDICILGIKY